MPRRIGCALPPGASSERESGAAIDSEESATGRDLLDLPDDDAGSSGLEVGRWLLRFGVPHASPLDQPAAAPHDTLYGIGYKPLRPDELSAGAYGSQSSTPLGALKGAKGTIRGHV